MGIWSRGYMHLGVCLAWSVWVTHLSVPRSGVNVTRWRTTSCQRPKYLLRSATREATRTHLEHGSQLFLSIFVRLVWTLNDKDHSKKSAEFSWKPAAFGRSMFQHVQPGKPYGRFFWTEPVFGSFFPYGHFLLAGGRIWP